MFFKSVRRLVLLLFAVVIILTGNVVTASADYDFEIWIDEGWTLFSVPRWVESVDTTGGHIEAWLVFEDGEWHTGTEQQMLEEANNPLRAIFMKASEPVGLRFTWAEVIPENEFAEHNLNEGWNLIGSGMQESYRNVLANLIYDNTSGLTQIYAPNSFNKNKEMQYFMPWQQPLISLVSGGETPLETMSPLDGYWVYLSGDQTNYASIIDQDPVMPVRQINIYKGYANPDQGYNYAYYLFIPPGAFSKEGQNYLMVGPNNTGTGDDNQQVHDESAYQQAFGSWKTYIAFDLHTPLLVPTFPRPSTEWWNYTHALNRKTLQISEGPLERIDLQLIAMDDGSCQG